MMTVQNPTLLAIKKVFQRFDEIYAGQNQPLWDHLKNKPKSTIISAMAHMELHLINLTQTQPLSSLTIMQKRKPHYFWSSITSFLKSHTLALADFPEIVSQKLAVSLSSVSYIVLLPLNHSHLIGYSESSQPWQLEVVPPNVFHCICAPILWALHPQETKSICFWRLKWAACTSFPPIAVFMPSSHWRHGDPSNPPMLLGIFNLL